MKAALALVTVAAMAAAAAAQTATQILQPHPDHPDACWDPATGTAHAVGATWTAPGCLRSSCARMGTRYRISSQGCGLIALPPGCKMEVRNPGGEHPDCCPKPVCNRPTTPP